jgi:O-antigen/teichoic acid export membrane protein
MKNERFKQLCHFIAGIALLPFAFKLFEQRHFMPSGILLVGGILFLIISGLLEWLENNLGAITKLVYLLECGFLLVAAFFQYHLNKRTPAMAFAGGGAVYFLLFLYFLYGKDEQKKSRKRKNKHRSRKKSNSNIDIEEV